METEEVCTRAYSKAEQRNSEGEWEDLTRLKNKQIRTEGKVQVGTPVNLNSQSVEIQNPGKDTRDLELQNVKIHNRGWTKIANFYEELAKPSEANRDCKEEEGRR